MAAELRAGTCTAHDGAYISKKVCQQLGVQFGEPVTIQGMDRVESIIRLVKPLPEYVEQQEIYCGQCLIFLTPKELAKLYITAGDAVSVEAALVKTLK